MNAFLRADIGSIVYCRFPNADGSGTLPHYALVVGVESDLQGTRYLLAYGSSKRVSAEGHLEHEFVLAGKAELLQTGLRVPTRFDLLRTCVLQDRECVVVGEIPRNAITVRRLRLAALAAGLL